MEKGQIKEITIEDISTEGQGIGRAEGMVIFVPKALPGDRVKVEITKVKKRFSFGKVIEKIKESPWKKEEDLCPYSGFCGGCPYMGITYDKQLEIKESQVKNKLQRLGGLEFDKTESTVFRKIEGASEIYRYRNKAVMPISTGGLITRKGGIQEPVHEPRIGFRPARSNEVTDCTDCMLQTEIAMAAAQATRRFMTEDHITSYDERWDKGLMKSMTVKVAFGTGEVMVIYDINGKGIPGVAKLIEYLDDYIYEAGGSFESLITRSSSTNAKAKIQTVAGKPTITDMITLEDGDSSLSLNFEISAESFYQVNPVQMVKLYSIVRQFIKKATETEGERKPVILDLYCGIGTIGLCMADLAHKVYGIEIVKDAIIDANRNATINGIVNATYQCGKAEELISTRATEGDIAILDPPRAGCKEELLHTIADAEIPHVIYVSCDPATLARDIKILRERGYEAIEVAPVEMFCHTAHVETCCLLRRRAETKAE